MLIRSRVRPASSGSSGDLFVAGPTDTGFYNRPGYPGGTSDKAGTALTVDTSGSIVVQSNTTYNNYKNIAFGEIGTASNPVHNVTFNSCVWENTGNTAPCVKICADGPITFNYCTVRPGGLTNNTTPVDGADGYQFAFLADGSQA